MPRTLALCFACLLVVTGFSLRSEYLERRTPPAIPNLELVEGVAGARLVGDKILVSEVRSLWPAEEATAQKLLDTLHPVPLKVTINRIFETERSDEQVRLHNSLTNKINKSLAETLGPDTAWAFVDIDTEIVIVQAERWNSKNRFSKRFKQYYSKPEHHMKTLRGTILIRSEDPVVRRSAREAVLRVVDERQIESLHIRPLF